MNKFYWTGNAAKSKIIKLILEEIQNLEEEVTIFDHGCGNAGKWKNFLTDHQNVKYIGSEPDAERIEKSKKELQEVNNVELYTANQLKDKDFSADFIISFSVFEHVYHKRDYLKTAKKFLAEDGKFFLNYDDGHFRNKVNLKNIKNVIRELKIMTHNFLSPILAKMGYVSWYQERVNYNNTKKLLKEEGFQITNQFYSNLENFKGLSKHIKDTDEQEFTKFWIETETKLNKSFKKRENYKEDINNLWRIMGSNTFVLKHQ
ncbi:MAG: class I SAM-dependent methyltransferase [Candidatus Magasanikbacteria bacterium]